MTIDEARRTSFSSAADSYDAARPGYPAALFDDLLRLGRVPSGGRALEIGAGTGKASVALARRGLTLVALEPGAGMAAVARRNLAGFEGVEVVERRLEDWELEEEAFDLVVAAQSFHWVEPEAGLEAIARALRPGRVAGLFWNTTRFQAWAPEQRRRVDALYARYLPNPDTRPIHEAQAERLAAREAMFAASPWFEGVEVRRYRWEATYDASTYLTLIDTYSDHRILPESVKAPFYRELRDAVEATGGAVTLPYEAALFVLRRG